MRDAQCGWIQLHDPSISKDGGITLKHFDTHAPKIILLLVIYSSRGLIEIYSMRRGERLVISQVGVGMRLMQTSDGVLGRPSSQFQTKPKFSRCLLLAPTGELNEIILDYQSVLEELSKGKQMDICRLVELYAAAETEKGKRKLLESIRQIVGQGDVHMALNV